MSVRTPGGRQRGRVRLHRVPTLRADETTLHHNIPVTTPTRTLLDLASTLPRAGLERALDRAESLELFDLRELQRAIDAHQGRRGSAALAAALAAYEPTITRSVLEEAFLALCADQALERPQANARVCGLEVDFYFARQRLCVEVDGYRYHRTRRAFERDRERDAILAANGYRTLRFTDRQVTRRPREVAAAITKVTPRSSA